MKPIFRYTILMPVRTYLLALAVLFCFQHWLLYFPSTDNALAESISGNREIKTVSISTDEGKTVGRVVGSGSCLVVYFWWNAENTDYLFSWVPDGFSGCAFAAMNYRGYGMSDGSPNEENMHADVLAWFDRIIAEFHPKTIIAVGRSLGTNVAIYVAHERSVNKLVLITPYDSIASVAQAHYPIFPVKLLIRDGFYSDRIAPDIRTPTLVLIAGKDTVVPRANTDHLLAAFSGIKPQVTIIPSADHNSIADTPEYVRALENFVKEK